LALPQAAVPLVGATHTSEITFVFAHTYNLPWPNGTCNMTESEVNISKFLVSAWTEMAINQKLTQNNQLWPAYGNASQSLGLNIVNSTTPGYVNYALCALWDEVTQTLDQAAGVNVSSAASEGNNSNQPSSSKSGAQSFGVRTGDLSLAIFMAVAVFALTRTHFLLA
jgi:hypothetical protein